MVYLGILLFRERIIRCVMQRIVYFEGAQARRKYGGEMVLRVANNFSRLI